MVTKINDRIKLNKINLLDIWMTSLHYFYEKFVGAIDENLRFDLSF